MPALRELQSRFAAAVLDGDETALLADLVEAPALAQRRLAAYRRNVRGNLIAALESTYCVLCNIVGQDFLRAAAREFIAVQPSRSGDLNDYGEEFAAFIAAWPHAADLPYLGDVARMEWRVQQVYYATDAAVPDLGALAECAPEHWGELRFAFHAGWARFDSPWPLADIWRVNQPGYDGAMGIDFDLGAQLLILRRHGRVAVLSLAPGEAALIDALAAGLPLAAAHAAASAATTELDLTAALQRIFEFGLVSRVIAAEDAP